MTDNLVERLRSRGQSDRIGLLGGLAANEIERLQEALAAAEARHGRVVEGFMEVCEAVGVRFDAPEAVAYDITAKIDNARFDQRAAEAKLASLPALLAETRKKALEEAAALIEANMLCGPEGTEVLLPRFNNGNKLGLAYAAAIRSLSNDEAPK